MDKLKRYECGGDYDGNVWIVVDGGSRTKISHCYRDSDVEALEVENVKLKEENKDLLSRLDYLRWELEEAERLLEEDGHLDEFRS